MIKTYEEEALFQIVEEKYDVQESNRRISQSATSKLKEQRFKVETLLWLLGGAVSHLVFAPTQI